MQEDVRDHTACWHGWPSRLTQTIYSLSNILRLDVGMAVSRPFQDEIGQASFNKSDARAGGRLLASKCLRQSRDRQRLPLRS
jgi:hypothetical protein